MKSFVLFKTFVYIYIKICNHEYILIIINIIYYIRNLSLEK